MTEAEAIREVMLERDPKSALIDDLFRALIHSYERTVCG